MPKITFIGAGSTIFAKNLIGDILSFPEFSDATLCLFDIDAERLKTSEIVAHRIAETLGAIPKVEVTTDREAAFDGADYAINMIQVAGYKPGTVIDFEVPKTYGLRQTIADTLGIGGIMRGLRTIPVLLDMCRDMERLCPDVVHLNYVNPMAMNCWALSRAPFEEINYLVAGINHMAFYLKFERDGEDLYPLIQKVIDEGRVPEWNQVRYEMFKRLGYFVTESSEHFSEYVPWFIKHDRPELTRRFNIPLDEYLRRCEVQLAEWEGLREELEHNNGPIEVRRSVEYGSRVLHSLETGTPRVVYGNVPNNHLIDNLPQGCCVEVPCLVDKNGIQPTHIGNLPPQLAALMQTNINVQALTVETALTGKREHIYHAAMLDPHTAAELDLEQIWNLVDELIEAHGATLPSDFSNLRDSDLAAKVSA